MRRPASPLLACPLGMLVLVASACSGSSDGGSEDGQAIPGGFKLVAHPNAQVAVPQDWVEVDDDRLREIGPDGVRYAPPDAPEEPSFGASIVEYPEPVPAGEEIVPILDAEGAFADVEGFDAALEEDVEVAGADTASSGTIRTADDDSQALPALHFHIVSARRGEIGTVLRVMTSPADASTADQIASTFALTGG